MTKEEAVERARRDLAGRLKVDPSNVVDQSVQEADFPDMALGAAEEGEMSGQMITRGWRIRLSAGDKTYEYRADKNQLRLYNYKGTHRRI